MDLPEFWIAKYPVTVAEYSRYLEDGHAAGREPGDWEEQHEHPNWRVVRVTWLQAAEYAKWAKARLPSEEEWERAARGPKRLIYPWGNTFDKSLANTFESSIGHPTPVGLYPSGASVEGVVDMAFNVVEWTASKYSEISKNYVIRGGSFDSYRHLARSAYRDVSLGVGQNQNLGFRLAKDADNKN